MHAPGDEAESSGTPGSAAMTLRAVREALCRSEEQYRSLFAAAAGGVLACAADGHVTACNVEAERMLGMTLEHMRLRPADVPLWSAIREDGSPVAPAEHPVELALRSSRALRGVVLGFGVAAERQQRWFLVNAAPTFEAGLERPSGAIVTLIDITERKRAEAALREGEERFGGFFSNLPIGLYRTTPSGRICLANPALVRLLGYSSFAELSQRNLEIEGLGPGYPRRQILERLERDGEIRGLETCWTRRDGSLVYVRESAKVIRQEDGSVAYYEGTIEDITERKQAEETIHHLAYHDALTGLPNRMLFNDRLAVALAHAQRTREKVAVLFLDLDHFKNINDSLGHGAGDQTLQGVAQRLTALLREGDTVARTGGDEFTLLLPVVSQVDDAARVAQRILQVFQQPWLIDGQEFKLTPSIGIALFPLHGEQAEALLQNADAAMYQAKELGRNNYQYYAKAMHGAPSQRLAMQSNLQRALDRGEFLLHYQPRIHLRTGRLVGVEALLRWQRPDVGLVPPLEFMPLAEESGLIVAIGEWVLRTACAQNRAWQAAGLPPVPVSVNLSARQFRQVNLIEMIADVLENTDLPPQGLELEITEGATQDAEWAAPRLQRLHAMGVRICLDNFGTGFSSLSHLKRLPITSLKVDRSFVSDIPGSLNDAAIVTGVIMLGHGLNLTVVAEGVETKQQVDFLREQQCDEVQGYLFSRPQPSPHIGKLLSHLTPDGYPRETHDPWPGIS